METEAQGTCGKSSASPEKLLTVAIGVDAPKSEQAVIAAAVGQGRVWAIAIAVFFGSTILVLATSQFGDLIVLNKASGPTSLSERMGAWDGQWYARIATNGYDYARTTQSTIVYFPAYPMLARAVAHLANMGIFTALLLVSNTFFLGALILWAAYLKDRVSWPDARSATVYAIIAMGVWPSTFFFHMCYTEAMLVFLGILTLYGMQQSWPPVVVALIIGLATATRSVGVALLAPFAFYLWESSRHALTARVPERSLMRATAQPCPAPPSGREFVRFLKMAMLLMPLACWGLAAFMGYQWWRFGDPLAFGKAQMVWHVRPSPDDIGQYIGQLGTLEAIRNTYIVGTPCYWGNYTPRNSAVLNLNFANPIFFVGAALLLLLGGMKRWLNRREIALGAMLLLIPYVTQSCRQCTISEARFASIAFPTYLVIGHLLARIPRVIAVYLIVCSCVMLGIYTALFTDLYAAW